MSLLLLHHINPLYILLTVFVSLQTCLLSKDLESLVEPSVQLMRKCLTKTPLPLTSDRSAYSFPMPGRAHAVPAMDAEPGTVFTTF